MKYACLFVVLVCLFRLVMVFSLSTNKPIPDSYDNYNQLDSVAGASSSPLSSIAQLFTPNEGSGADWLINSMNSILSDLTYFDVDFNQGNFWDNLGAILQAYLVVPVRMMLHVLIGVVYIVQFLLNFIVWLFSV